MPAFRCRVMVGRADESRRLRAAVAAARTGHGSVIAVVGPPGIGKSRLVDDLGDDLAGHQRGGVLWLRGRCVEGGSPPALRPFTEALLSGLRSVGVPAGPDLDPFLPALNRVVPFWPVAPRPVDGSTVVLAEGVLRLIGAAAGHAPAVLVLEDLQWADPDSLGVLEYVADNIAGTKTLVVVTARTGPGAARTLLGRLAARGAVQEIALHALPDEDSRRLATACLPEPPSPELLDLVLERADGVPLLIEELIGCDPSTLHLGQIPESVAAVTTAKLSSLGDAAAQVVRAAAVLGIGFDWDLLVSVVDLGPAGTIDALWAAMDADLVVETGDGGFAFRHALTRDAVLASMVQPERAIVSRRAWEALKAGDGVRGGAQRAEAAEFAVLAGETTAAVALFHAAARADLDRGSLATAEARLRRARSLATDRSQIVEADELSAELLVQQGRPTEAAVTTARLMAELRADGRSTEIPAAHLRLARAWAAAERWTDAACETTAARAAAPDPGLLLQLDQLDALIAFGRQEFADAEDLARAVLDTASAAGRWDLACDALTLLGRVARRRDLPRAAALFDRALRTAEARDLPVRRLRALHEISTVDLLWSLDPRSAERAGAEAQRHGAVDVVAFSGFHRAVMHCWRDELDAASSVLAGCERLCRSLDMPLLAMVLTIRALVATKRGQQPDAVCADALGVAGDDAHVRAAVNHVRATRLLLAEDRPRALAALDPSIDEYRSGMATTSGPPLALWTLLATLERGDEALDHVRDMPGIRLARWTVGYLGYAEAVSLGRQGRADDATTAFAAADHTMTNPVSMPHFRHLARRHVAQDAIEHGWGEPHRWLREDERHFRDNGHTSVAAACRGLLRRLGQPVPRRTPGPPVPDALAGCNITGREMEVLHLVADGLSNPEIADRLVLSVRTVEKHVERLLAKTGAVRRTDLAARVPRRP